MEGFISVKGTIDGDIVEDVYGNLKLQKGCAHNVATFFQRFRVDKKNNVYVDGLKGAIVGNIDVSIESIDDLEKFKDKKTGKNPYQRFLDMGDKGYVLVVGRPFPSQHGGSGGTKGIYCKNYLDIVKEQKRIEKLNREKLKAEKQNKTEDVLTID